MSSLFVLYFNTMNAFTILILFMLCQVHQSAQEEDCPISITQKNNELLLLSDKQVDGNSANSFCTSAGSEFFQILNDETRQQLDSFLRRKLITNEFATVTIRHKPGNTTEHKYRSSSGGNDTQNIDEWKIPQVGRLREIIKYRYPTGPFNKPIQFCYACNRDIIADICNTKSGFHINFALESGRNFTKQAIPLFLYTSSGFDIQSTNLFLNDSVAMPFLIKASNPYAIYIPDISVFIGAQINVGQNKWISYNRTMVTDKRFPTSNISACQQMTWPLTYDDGINLRPKSCEKEAYALCKFDFEVTVSPIKCNGSTLKVSWNQPGLENITTEANNLSVNVKVGNDFNRVVPMSKKTVFVHGLAQRTKYDISATLIYENCNNASRKISITAYAKQTTSVGIPEPVKNPVVRNSTNEAPFCQIEWNYNVSYIEEVMAYQITVKSLNATYKYNISNQNLATSEQMIFRHNISTSQAPREEMLELKVQVFSCEGGSDISTAAGACILPSEPPLATAVIVVIIFASILIIAAVGWICYKRKKNNISKPQLGKSEEQIKDKNFAGVNEEVNIGYQNIQPSFNKDPLHSNEVIYESVGRTTDDLVKYLLEESSSNFKKTRKEFFKIVKTSSGQEESHNFSINSDNSKKNRYKNIYPYDHARVQLEGGEYINASYIDGTLSNRKYIATQGPKRNTVDDFWEMVWKENSTIIVMLCKCVERGKKKCEVYWPLAECIASYGKFEAKNLSEEDQGGIIKRTFIVKRQDFDGLERKIVQFHFTSWPDHDVPLTTSGMIRLRSMVNEEHSQIITDGRIIVHCSAGAGRTGTYIAIDNLLEKYQSTGDIDIFAAVMKMRKNRTQMIQTTSQYIFVHKVLLESIVLPITKRTTSEIQQMMEKENWIDIAVEEYNKLSLVVFSNVTNEAEPVYQNNSSPIISDKENQLIIFENNKESKVIDAHFIENERFPFWFIASSGFQLKNGNSFFDMIMQRNAKVVVCLEYLEHDKIVSGGNKAVDDIIIDQYKLNINIIEENKTYTVMKLSILEAYQEKVDFNFTLIFMSSWQNTPSPPGAECFVDVVDHVLSCMDSNQSASALVYCRDGCSRTGIFLVFANLLQQLKQSQFIDVFRSVKDLQDLRPGSLDNVEFYKLCYKLINDFIESNSEYVTVK